MFSLQVSSYNTFTYGPLRGPGGPPVDLTAKTTTIKSLTATDRDFTARQRRCGDIALPGCIYLDIEEGVEVGDDDVLVLHLAPHVLDGVDGRFVVRLWATAKGQLLQPEAAHLEERVEHQPGELHGLQL